MTSAELSMTENIIFKEFLEEKVCVKVGDITTECTDAIVNAANSTLLGGGGVDGAIHREGGPSILEECKKLRETEYPNGLGDGEVAVTNSGKLFSWIVIHTVGPVWKGGEKGEPEKLRACYLNVLDEAERHGCLTISFPAISTGIYHYPKELAAEVASIAIQDYFDESNLIAQVRLVFFSEEDAKIFTQNQKFKN